MSLLDGVEIWLTSVNTLQRWCAVADVTEVKDDVTSHADSDEVIPVPVVKCEQAESSQDAPGGVRSVADLYHCQTCDIYFRNIVMYTIHAGTHSRVNPLECNVCGRVSRDCYEFMAHLSFGDHCRVVSLLS